MTARRYRIKALAAGGYNVWHCIGDGRTRLLKTCSTRNGAKAYARRHAGEDGVAVFEVAA